jgi:hypothetical protein
MSRTKRVLKCFAAVQQRCTLFHHDEVGNQNVEVNAKSDDQNPKEKILGIS